MRKEKGVAFSPFFLCSWSKKLSILYTKVYTHAQILSEANFAKQRRFGVLFTQRRGVLFRTRRRQCSRGALGTRRVRFSFLERCLMWFDLISFFPKWKKGDPLSLCSDPLSSLLSFSLLLLLLLLRIQHQKQYSTDAVVTDFEHSTGLYRAELEGLASGKDIFDHYDFTRAPKGTKESPCVVTSEMEYRVVGVTDPDDDSIVIWGRLEEGKGPMLIGDEWFVHKRVGGGGAH